MCIKFIFYFDYFLYLTKKWTLLFLLNKYTFKMLVCLLYRASNILSDWLSFGQVRRWNLWTCFLFWYFHTTEWFRRFFPYFIIQTYVVKSTAYICNFCGFLRAVMKLPCTKKTSPSILQYAISSFNNVAALWVYLIEPHLSGTILWNSMRRQKPRLQRVTSVT